MDTREREMRMRLSARVLKARDYPPQLVHDIFESGVYDGESREIVEYIKNNPDDKQTISTFVESFFLW